MVNITIVLSLLLSLSLGLKPAGSQDYDFYLLEIQWRQTQCMDKGCRPGFAAAKFGIHGLWPTTAQPPFPANCEGEEFSVTDETAAQLDELWPSYKNEGPDTNLNFWVYEWQKHGTCVRPPVSSESYFTKVLELFNSLNIDARLKNAEIAPGAPFALSTLQELFDGRKVNVKCRQKKFVSALRICFGKDYKLQDCEGQEKKSCDQEVFLPAGKGRPEEL